MVGMIYFKETECSVLGKGCTKESVSCQYDSDDDWSLKETPPSDSFIVLKTKFNC